MTIREYSKRLSDPSMSLDEAFATCHQQGIGEITQVPVERMTHQEAFTYAYNRMESMTSKDRFEAIELAREVAPRYGRDVVVFTPQIEVCGNELELLKTPERVRELVARTMGLDSKMILSISDPKVLVTEWNHLTQTTPHEPETRYFIVNEADDINDVAWESGYPSLEAARHALLQPGVGETMVLSEAAGASRHRFIAVKALCAGRAALVTDVQRPTRALIAPMEVRYANLVVPGLVDRDTRGGWFIYGIPA